MNSYGILIASFTISQLEIHCILMYSFLSLQPYCLTSLRVVSLIEKHCYTMYPCQPSEGQQVKVELIQKTEGIGINKAKKTSPKVIRNEYQADESNFPFDFFIYILGANNLECRNLGLQKLTILAFRVWKSKKKYFFRVSKTWISSFSSSFIIKI